MPRHYKDTCDGCGVLIAEGVVKVVIEHGAYRQRLWAPALYFCPACRDSLESWREGRRRWRGTADGVVCDSEGDGPDGPGPGHEAS